MPLEADTLERDAPTTDMPLITRRAPVRANSYDEATRTVEAIISTGAAVRRRDARGTFLESLSIAGITPSTLVGTPVLDSHRQQGTRDLIGRIEQAWIENGDLVASIRLSSAPDVEPIAHRIAEGILRGVSVGYRVTSWQDGTDATTGERTRKAVAWAIHEISFVPVPADPGATVRSQDMPETATVETTPTSPDPRIATRGAIRAIARSAGLSTEWADAQIDADADVNAARAAAFEEMQRRSNVVIRTQQTGQSNDDPAAIITRRMDAVAARVMGTAPNEAARPFMGDRLTDHARAILTLRGHSTAGMDQDALVRAAMHTTSDFQNLLTGVGNRTLMPAYQAAQSPLKQLCRQALHNDFRPSSRLRLGELGEMEKVTEAGEIKSTSRGEAIEAYALETYGSKFSLSRKALINDDLGAFRDWGQVAGNQAAEKEAKLIVALLLSSNGAGPTMGDGKSLFNAAHGNLGAPVSMTDTGSLTGALDAARFAMRMQKGLDGKTPINAAAKFLVVSAELETLAEKVLSEIAPGAVADANPFAGRLTLLVEPRLPAGSWYTFADPAILPVLEYAYLSSAQGPQMASREGWDVLGMEFRVVLDFGCGALDWRGAYRTPKSL